MGELELLVHSLHGSSDAAAGRWLVLAAHPDDETIGATWILARAPRLNVVFVTDGGPVERRLWPPGAPRTREEYAALRERESLRALALVSVRGDQIVRLGVRDQEATLALSSLTSRLAELFERLAPSVVVVPPYEGGHPDHDATSFAAHAARRIVENRGGDAPSLIEMTSYHRRDGSLVTGAFLQDALQGEARVLSDAERARKSQMMAAYASQAGVLAAFGVAEERFRPAPEYDFTVPPHPGVLHYETLGFALNGEAWREHAARALDDLGLR